MSENVVLDKIGLTAKAVLPKDAKVILFGSRARGDARADSDWDLLIILNKVNRDIDDINNYACPFMELGYEINQEINNRLASKSTLKDVEGPLENGQTAILDFCGKLNGIAFKGGTATDYQLEIGSHTFVAGFEEQMVGMKKKQ